MNLSYFGKVISNMMEVLLSVFNTEFIKNTPIIGVSLKIDAKNC